MKNPLGVFPTQEGPLALVLFLEILYLRQPPNFSSFWSRNKEVFSAKDLVLCHGQAQMAVLSNNFLLLVALRCNSRGHHSDLGILFLELVPKALQSLWCKIISFLCSQVYWCCNLDQEWRSNKNCLTTFPRHPLVLHKRAIEQCSCSLTRIWKFFQIHSI